MFLTVASPAAVTAMSPWVFEIWLISISPPERASMRPATLTTRLICTAPAASIMMFPLSDCTELPASMAKSPRN